MMNMKNVPIIAAVVSISDTRTDENDISGDTVVGRLLWINAEVAEKVVISDDLSDIRTTLVSLSGQKRINLIITTGGTGLAERDNTPEATKAIIEKEAPGLAEAMRRETYKNTPKAMLSRGVCGIRKETLIINLPGSPDAVLECFEVIDPILQHAINQICGNKNH